MPVFKTGSFNRSDTHPYISLFMVLKFFCYCIIVVSYNFVFFVSLQKAKKRFSCIPSWYPNLSQSPFLSFLSVLFKGQKGQVSFALENLKPVVWPYGQEGIPLPSCPSFTKKGSHFLKEGPRQQVSIFCCVVALPSNTLFVRKTFPALFLKKKKR